MPYIQLSGKRGQDKQTLVDESTFTKWGMLKWHLSDTGYVVRRVNNETARLHRLVTNCPEDMFVDHLNGNRLDNRLGNLRICTHAENMKNYHGAKGYTFDKSKGMWMVRYKAKFYGRYKTEEEANKAYQLAKSGVQKIDRQHPRRKYLPKGVQYMQRTNRYYVRPMVKGKRKLLGYFSTVQEAETTYNKFLEQGGLTS